jgi:quinol monooxygenase YgiN
VPQPLVYVDRSDVRPGALEALKDAIEELAELIEASEPQLVAYNAYFSDDGTRMTVIHIHADAASLDRHLEIGGPAFGKFAELLSLSSIDVYGEPSDKAMRQLQDKARLLGRGDVVVHRPAAGFSRLRVLDARP